MAFMDDEYKDRKIKEFYDKYPKLFPEGEPVCGFYCEHGWRPILDKLCQDITKELDSMPEPMNITVQQVKEKFGGLRFYISSGTDTIFDLINAAEQESTTTCETCGKPGMNKATVSGWYKTMCEECEIKINKSMKSRGF